MSYPIATFPMTLSDLHSCIGSLSECDFSYSCAAVDKISTDVARASRGPSATAELLVDAHATSRLDNRKLFVSHLG